jgi:Gram-negative bacterial TonB protein C-terminal
MKLLARLSPTSTSASSPDLQLEESPKAEAPHPSPKPNAKTNMLAREVRVMATAALPGKSAGERDLYTEETTSSLVHEHGGVIQLSAAVVRGQLLLLANVEAKREVVAQVKRIYKQNRCVELEFAEPSPRFWGMEFSAAAALLPKNATDVEAAARVISAEADDDEPLEPPPAPTAEEVQALRRELEALQQQVPGPAATVKSQSTEQDPVPAQPIAAEQAQLPNSLSAFTMPLPKAKRPFRARGKFTPGFRGGLFRFALLSAALVATVVGAAWFKHWLPWSSTTKKPMVHLPAIAANATTPLPRATREAALANSEFINTNVASAAPVTSPRTPLHIPESPAQPFASSRSAAPPPVKRTSPSTTPVENRAVVRPAKAASDPVAPPAAETASSVDGVIVPPKLIKSVRAVASLDAVRDFETGNVVIDAVVGTEGEMHLIKVLSGPPSLRAPAVEAVKQYRYEPATRNGQPVPEHVTIIIRFRFES